MRARPSFGHALLVALIAAGTTWAALLAWRGFLTDSFSYLAPLAVTAVMIAAAGAVLRWLGSPALAVVAVQLLIGVAMVSSELGGSPLPAGAAAQEIGSALTNALDSARTYAAPIQADVPSVAPLLFLGGVVFLLLVDFLACTLRRVPIAGLALLAIYSVPAGLVKAGPSWVAFLLAAIGFLALLHLDSRDHLLKWGRSLGSESSSPWAESNPVADAVRVGAGRIGAIATACALLIPPFVPVLNIDLLAIGPGDGDDNIQIRNPRTDLRRDLEQPDEVALVRFHTDDPHPGYLRIASLDRFTGNEWSTGDRGVADEDTATGALPTPTGLDSDVPRTSYTYQFQATEEFDSTWLPTPFPASSVTADGDWRFDPDTFDFLAVPDDLTTKGLDWSATGLDLDFGTDGRFFKDPGLDEVDDEFLEVPGGLPSIVRSQAVAVTSGARDDYEAALLLQDWFRERGGFRYSLKKAPSGIGGDAFESFLDADAPEGRVGYCEQFASAMAVMARMVGIPARVAVGFLSPDDLGNGNFEYTSDSLHAWPELYFHGTGWVGFEPTPSRISGTPPDYTTVPVDIDNQSESTSATSASGPDRTLTEEATATETRTAPEEQTPADQSSTDDAGTDWLAVILQLGAGLLVLVLLGALGFGPRLLRRRARERRLAGTPEDVWDELRATAVDLDLPWPAGRSPQEVGRVLVEHLGDRTDPNRPERPRTGPDADPEAAMALERVVAALELVRYARPGSTVPSPGLADDARTCVASLEAGAARGAVVRARWLPRSIGRSGGRRSIGDTAREEERVGV
ncbi:transglutaminaseTgpA domain-containing protein [Nocardioides sp. MH1]|uniref:transglutaminase family protein n=1 Tax=Nocardioides sp. MH1 TaxID=3242490 RepID=UPI00351FBD96